MSPPAARDGPLKSVGTPILIGVVGCAFGRRGDSANDAAEAIIAARYDHLVGPVSWTMTSYRNWFDFIKGDFVAGPIAGLGRARIFPRRDGLGVLRYAAGTK